MENKHAHKPSGKTTTDIRGQRNLKNKQDANKFSRRRKNGQGQLTERTLYKLYSKTSSGPVAPRIVNGWADNKENIMPHNDDAISISDTPM